MIYFDLILQKNVVLKKNGKSISTANPEWYFYEEYWNSYIKLIQARNRGLGFHIKYVGLNNRGNRNDIYDFEISFLQLEK